VTLVIFLISDPKAARQAKKKVTSASLKGKGASSPLNRKRKATYSEVAKTNRTMRKRGGRGVGKRQEIGRKRRGRRVGEEDGAGEEEGGKKTGRGKKRGGRGRERDKRQSTFLELQL
jgi:hypothetical protein